MGLSLLEGGDADHRKREGDHLEEQPNNVHWPMEFTYIAGIDTHYKKKSFVKMESLTLSHFSI